MARPVQDARNKTQRGSNVPFLSDTRKIQAASSVRAATHALGVNIVTAAAIIVRRRRARSRGYKLRVSLRAADTTAGHHDNATPYCGAPPPPVSNCLATSLF
ncbi:unnamed protein product, partial [Iphiclides podalirius]